jgi:hypothetical protein
MALESRDLERLATRERLPGFITSPRLGWATVRAQTRRRCSGHRSNGLGSRHSCGGSFNGLYLLSPPDAHG